jgi:hypothetical protein
MHAFGDQLISVVAVQMQALPFERKPARLELKHIKQTCYTYQLAELLQPTKTALLINLTYRKYAKVCIHRL